MKKLAIGFAILGSIAFVGVGGRALAADPAPAGAGDEKAAGGSAAGGGDDANTTYKAKTVYDFEDDTVEGDLQRPDGERPVRARRPAQGELQLVGKRARHQSQLAHRQGPLPQSQHHRFEELQHPERPPLRHEDIHGIAQRAVRDYCI